jgi:WD domain, G-beta repeat
VIAEYGKRIQLWDVESGVAVTSLVGHDDGTNALAFSPDSKTLASGGHDTTILLWGVAQARVAGLRTELGEADGSAGPFSGSPNRAVAFLKEWLVRAAGAEKQVRPLLPLLDDDSFDIRERATADLEKLGLSAESPLREILSGSVSAEARRRIERVLKAIDKGRKGTADAGGRLRRVVKAPEAIDTADARKALRELARGDDGLTVTRLAREAAERLERSERSR